MKSVFSNKPVGALPLSRERDLGVGVDMAESSALGRPIEPQLIHRNLISYPGKA